MSENSAIEWCDHTFNPWEGCQKVGPGCDHCYAETRNRRWNKGEAINWGPGAPRRRTSASNWGKPIAWQKNAADFQLEYGRRQRVFCASLADVFDNAVDPAWRADLFALIAATPDLDWLLLTKRVGNAIDMLDEVLTVIPAPRWPWPNVWLGATVVNQEEADRDIPKLLATPARVRFLSCEPLLGPIDLEPGCETSPNWVGSGLSWNEMPDAQMGARMLRHGPARALDWVIAGGESGPGARPMHPKWARGLRDQCAAAGVPFLFKQWGEWAPWEPKHPAAGVRHLSARDGAWGTGPGFVFSEASDGYETRIDTYPLSKAGKKAAGRLLDGVQHDGFPA